MKQTGNYDVRISGRLTIARRLACGLLVGAAFLAACQSPIRAQHEYDATAPFGGYRSFAWVGTEPMLEAYEGNVEIGPVVEAEIRRAVERDLQAKGYELQKSPDDADFVVAFSVGTRERLSVHSYPTTYGYRYRRPGGWASDIDTYTEGALAIDMFDRTSKQAVWHGWATKRLRSGRSAEERKAVVGAAVSAILDGFPSRTTAERE